MNLKPFRDYDEHEVINLFSLNAPSGDKGSVVQLLSNDLDNMNGWSDQSLSSYPGTYSHRYEVKSKVKLAESGAFGDLLGIMLYDVREYDENGQRLIFEPKYKKDEMCVVCSGEAVPVLQRGLVEVSGYVGTAGVGSGAAVANAGGGAIKVIGKDDTSKRIGTFLSPSGADGYALLNINFN